LLSLCSHNSPDGLRKPHAHTHARPYRHSYTGAGGRSPELGAQLARDMGCTACRSIDGNPSVGPTWQGRFNSQRPLADGSTVQADEAYIRESIVSPNAKIAESFLPAIMPQDFGDRLSEPEVQAINEYIETLQ